MATLFEIDQAMLDLIDEETGEILDYDALEQLTIDKETKIKNIALWIMNLKSDSEQYAEMEKRFKEKKEKAKDKAERLSAFLQNYLQGEKKNYTECKISYTTSHPLEITDFTVIPDKWWREKVTREVDKVAIKDAIKNGESVDGCYIADKTTINIK